MRLVKRGDTYYVEFGRNKLKSLKTKDKTEANRRLHLLEGQMLEGKLAFLQGPSSLTFGAFLAEYDAWAEKHRSPNTWSRVHRLIPKFKTAIGSDKPLSSLRFKDLDNFVDYCRVRKNSPVTINLEIRSMKAAMSWGVKREYIKANPFKGYERLREQKKIPVFLTAEQIQKVFETIGDDRKYRLTFALYIYTGARREEINRLLWTDIKKEVVEICKTKNSIPRQIPILDNLMVILDENRRDVGRIIDVPLGYMAQRMKHYLRKAGLGHVRPHDLRHTFASHLVMAGRSLLTVGELLGHTSYAATMIYSHLSKEHLVEAIKGIKY